MWGAVRRPFGNQRTLSSPSALGRPLELKVFTLILSSTSLYLEERPDHCLTTRTRLP